MAFPATVALVTAAWAMDASAHRGLLSSLLFIGFVGAIGFILAQALAIGAQKSLWTYKQMQLTNLTDQELKAEVDAIQGLERRAGEWQPRQEQNAQKLHLERRNRERQRQSEKDPRSEQPPRPPMPDEPPPDEEYRDGSAPW